MITQHKKTPSSLHYIVIAALTSLCFIAQAQERQMNVTLGPETVFSRQISDIIPQLSGATMTNRNGRIGGELVFWEHTLNDASKAFLFACSLQKNVNCQERMVKICPAGSGSLLTSVTEPGNVRHIDCRAYANAGVGELRPGCTDKVRDNDMLVGLMQCSAL